MADLPLPVLPPSDPIPQPVQFNRPHRRLIRNLIIIIFLFLFTAGVYYFWSRSRPDSSLPPAIIGTPSPVITATPSPDPQVWTPYVNEEYGFIFNFPGTAVLNLDRNLTPYYDHLLSLTYNNSQIDVGVIADIDVYKQSTARLVADREIIDSGLKYSINQINVGSYDAVRVNIVNSDPFNKDKKRITIADPSQNLFVVFSGNLFEDVLDKLLSTFKFTGQSVAVYKQVGKSGKRMGYPKDITTQGDKTYLDIDYVQQHPDGSAVLNLDSPVRTFRLKPGVAPDIIKNWDQNNQQLYWFTITDGFVSKIEVSS